MVNEETSYAGDMTRSPILVCTLTAIICSFVSTGIFGAYLPRKPPMAWPIGFLIASAVLTVVAVALLVRKRNFAWNVFFSVAKWIVGLTAVFAGMAIFVFAYDKTPGSPLAVLSVVLVLAAVNIPLTLGFSVARHERVEVQSGSLSS